MPVVKYLDTVKPKRSNVSLQIYERGSGSYILKDENEGLLYGMDARTGNFIPVVGARTEVRSEWDNYGHLVRDLLL